MKAQKTKSWLSKWRFEVIALINGALVLILEIAGARIIAPELGASIYVWTSVIGVILAALSIGYWHGGRLADKGATTEVLSRILLMGSAVLAVSVATLDLIFDIANSLPGGVRVQALFASLMIFGPVSYLMGMVSPYLLKLKLSNLSTAGQAAGNIFAAGTVGSILGTFLSGYWLISTFGSIQVVWGVVLGLAALSFTVNFKQGIFSKFSLIALVPLFLALYSNNLNSASANVVFQGEGKYSHYKVEDRPWQGKTVRLLLTDGVGAQSGVVLGDNQPPAFSYISKFTDVVRHYPDTKRILLIGGGAFTFPDYIVKNYPDIEVDVVEIDPKAYELGKEYFGVQDSARMNIFFEDGRTFVNNNQKKYDLVFIDAFFSLSPPFQLATSEVAEKINDQLSPSGAVVINVISAVEGSKARFLQAEYSTYLQHFDLASVFQAYRGNDRFARQNLVLIATNSSETAEKINSGLEKSSTQVFPSKGQVLTDNFAPVEQMTTEN